MTQAELLNLLRFYLACVESEDRRSLRKSVSALNQSLVSPWETSEQFFTQNQVPISFSVADPSAVRFLRPETAVTGGPERLFYGYPIFLDGEGFVSPLFVAQVDVTHRGEDGFTMTAAESGELTVNHHLFQRQRTSLDELKTVQEELEGEFGSFFDRLQAAFQALGVNESGIAPPQLDPWPTIGGRRERWYSRPILFKSERSIFTHNLRRELSALIDYPKLTADVSSTALGAMIGLDGAKQVESLESNKPMQLAHIVPLNTNQELAAARGKDAPLCVVTGPPGTGKSQLIVELLGTHGAAGRAVLFASKNNKAVDVVRERLRTLLTPEFDWTLRLGSKKAMGELKVELAARLTSINPSQVPPAPLAEEVEEVESKLRASAATLAKISMARERYSAVADRAAMEERNVPESWVVAWRRDPQPLPPLASIEKLYRRCLALSGRAERGLLLAVGVRLFPEWLLSRARKGLASWSGSLPAGIDRSAVADGLEAESDLPSVTEAAALLFWLRRWAESSVKASDALAALTRLPRAQVVSTQLSSLQQRRAELGSAELRTLWTGRVASQSNGLRYEVTRYFDLIERIRSTKGKEYFTVLNQLRQSIGKIGSSLPVWIVTNLSARNAMPLDAGLFDLVIIDEASQCDIPSALPLLFRAKRAMIIGDPQQLQHISTLSNAEEQRLATEHGVEHLLSDWSYNRRSLYALADGVLAKKQQSPILLAEHYRSHPSIIGFSNRAFYGGQLIVRTRLGQLQASMQSADLGLFWHNVASTVSPTARGARNDTERRAVISLLDNWAASGMLLRESLTFGIVTPFRLQVESIEQAVRERPWWPIAKGRLTVGTAHQFQGDECDVMLFSPVVAGGLREPLVRWVADTQQLLNVAITRARAAFHIVGDREACLRAGGSLGAFAAAVQDVDGGPTVVTGTPGEIALAKLLDEAGLFYAREYAIGRYRLDFLVVGPLGTRYDVEVDGRGHLTDAAIIADKTRNEWLMSQGLKIVRIAYRDIFHRRDDVLEVLSRLV